MPGFFPRRPRRHLRIEGDEVVESVFKRFEQILNDRDRGKWMDDRLNRYAKYRGWLPERTWPWVHSSNVHVPILQSAELRANAGLYNVLMTTRPLMTPRALSRANVPREQRVGELIDAQLWVDPTPEHAERRFSDVCSAFLQDGNWAALTPWARDEREVSQVFFRPPVPTVTDPNAYVERLLLGTAGAEQNGGPASTPGIFPPGSTAEPDSGADAPATSRWKIASPQGPAMAWVYEEADGGLEIVTK
mgnify:FL=1